MKNKWTTSVGVNIFCDNYFWLLVIKERKMHENEAKELVKPVIAKFKRRKIFVKGIDDVWQADLLIQKENEGYKYILVTIDCFSKCAWCVAIKKKDAIAVTETFKKIRTFSKRKPQFCKLTRAKNL